MDSLNEEQYERVARHLDGAHEPLSPAEEAAATEVRRDELLLVGRLDVTVPPEAMARARRRLVAALARPARRPTRWHHYGIRAAVGVAAAGLLAVVLFRPPPRHDTAEAPGLRAPGVSLNTWYGAMRESATDDEIDLIGRELDELEAEMIVSQPLSHVELELDAIEQDIEELWLEESPGEMPET